MDILDGLSRGRDPQRHGAADSLTPRCRINVHVCTDQNHGSVDIKKSLTDGLGVTLRNLVHGLISEEILRSSDTI